MSGSEFGHCTRDESFAEFSPDPADRAAIAAGMEQLRAEQRAFRLAEMRRRLGITQAQVSEIAPAAAASPEHAGQLLGVADEGNHPNLRDTCRRVKADATDPLAQHHAVHAARALRTACAQWAGVFEGSDRRNSRTPLAANLSTQRLDIERGVMWKAAIWRLLIARSGVFLICCATNRSRSQGSSRSSRTRPGSP